MCIVEEEGGKRRDEVFIYLQLTSIVNTPRSLIVHVLRDTYRTVLVRTTHEGLYSIQFVRLLDTGTSWSLH